MSRGRLLVVEGLDGSGKTTLSRALEKALDGRWYTTPDRDLRELRDSVEAAMSSPDARQLFYAASVCEVASRLLRDLEQGHDVIVDRYWLSTWVYGFERGTSLALDEIERKLPAADLTLYLTADRQLRAQRMLARGKLTGADRRTLDPTNEARLQQRYREGLQRPIAGQLVELDTGTLDPDATLEAALAAIAGCPLAAPRSSGLQLLRGPLRARFS